MCTPQEGDELEVGEVIASTLIRCCLMQYTERLEECEEQLRRVILEPYEAGTLGHEPDEVWVVAHAYMMLGTVFVRRKEYDVAKEFLTSAMAFDKFPFSGTFHIQLKNTQDYAERRSNE